MKQDDSVADSQRVEWTSQAERLFTYPSASAGRLPREALLVALESWEYESWLRVRLSTQSDLSDLAVPRPRLGGADAPLMQVRRAAELFAQACGRTYVEAGDVAIGLGLTAQSCPDDYVPAVLRCLGLSDVDPSDLAEACRHVIAQLDWSAQAGITAADSGTSVVDDTRWGQIEGGTALGLETPVSGRLLLWIAYETHIRVFLVLGSTVAGRQLVWGSAADGIIASSMCVAAGRARLALIVLLPFLIWEDIPAGPMVLISAQIAAVWWRDRRRGTGRQETWIPRATGSLRNRVRLRRIDHDLKTGRWRQARQHLLPLLDAPRSDVQLRLAFAALRLEDLAAARNAAESATTATGRAAHLARLLLAETLLAQGETESAMELAAKVRSKEPSLGALAELVTAEISVSQGDWPKAVQAGRAALDLLPRRAGTVEYLHRACRVLFQAHLELSDPEGAARAYDLAEIEVCRVPAARPLLKGSSNGDYARIMGTRFVWMRHLFLLRAERGLALVHGDLVAPPAEVKDDPCVEMEEALVGLEACDAPGEAARAAQLLALGWMHRGARQSSLTYALRGLIHLDAVRHHLTTEAQRDRWSIRLLEALGLALKCQDTYGRLTAELIEAARVQALPDADGQQPGSLIPPPVIRVGGRAVLARSGSRLQPIDLEVAAGQAAGAGAWWWGSWEVDGDLYWAVTSDTGKVEAGKLSGSDPLWIGSLNRLRDMLPAPLPGETVGSDIYMERLRLSPMISGYAEEREIMQKLADYLVPPNLRRELLTRLRLGQPPLPLAIAAPPMLANFPWSALVIGTFDDDRPPVRLPEVARWVLAPSATLISATARPRQDWTSAPLKVAVLDTSAQSPLMGARALRNQMPEDVVVLGGEHWDATAATPQGVRDALAKAGSDSAAWFAVHAGSGAEGSASTTLAMSDSSPPLTAREIATWSTSARMPRQVILEACDSADLGSGSTGEWLSLAPSFMLGGTQTIALTLFPIFDLVSDEKAHPLQLAVARGDDLLECIQDLQRAGARAWDSAGDTWDTPFPLIDLGDHTPVSWAAWAACATSRLDVTPPIPTATFSPRTRATLRDTARGVGENRNTITCTDFALTYLEYETQAIDGGPFAGAIRAAVAAFWSSHRTPRSGTTRVNDALNATTCLTRHLSAAAQASASGGLPVHPEALINDMLASQCSGARSIGFTLASKPQTIAPLLRNTHREALIKEATTPRWSTKGQPSIGTYKDSARVRAFADNVISIAGQQQNVSDAKTDGS